MYLEDALVDSNPWWQGNFFNVSLKHRDIYDTIEQYIKKKQIIGIYGLRRTGKSYLIYHVIKKLLEKENPKSILYFSFDDFSETNALEVLKVAENLTKTQIKFIFFDEVQKLNNWAEQIKRLYDLKNLKIFVTGSEALFLRKTSKESLAGRIFEFKMNPLSFREYLEFKNISQEEIYKNDVKNALDHYLLIGGFPELIDEKDHFFIRKYIKEGIIDKAIYQEIPRRYRLEDPSVLERIMNIIIDNTGLLLDKNDLANTLGVFRTTVSKYLFYLESSFLIKSIYNYSRNASTSEKKLKKYYIGFSPLGVSLKHDSTYMGKVAENICVLKTEANFFWRSPQQDEVDIVLTDPLRGIEVKYREQPDIKGIRKFAHIFRTSDSLVITKETEEKHDNIRYIPLWKWLKK